MARQSATDVGAGQPLALDDDALVPEDLRVAYRILKNAGYVPPEVQTLKAHVRAVKKLALLRTKIESTYYAKALARLSR